MKNIAICAIAAAWLCLSFTKQKTFIPPGTVQVNDTLFADVTEISNFNWQEYETWNAAVYGKNSEQYKSCLPDTSVWRDKLSMNEPYVLHYYRHPAYREFPVVGVTYEQAVAYCKWRTDRAKTILSVKKNFKNQDFEFRLPTKAEWEKLAETSANLFSQDGKNEKGMFQFNFCRASQVGDSTSPSYPDVTTPVKSYSKNSLGLFNTIGNVAEMVDEKGICKGGGWKNILEECRIGNDINYSKPTAWIGFRCVCVVK